MVVLIALVATEALFREIGPAPRVQIVRPSERIELRELGGRPVWRDRREVKVRG